MSYDAFISYSHTADTRLAPALRHGLQTFAKPWHRRRALRVFHDEANLQANPNLWGTIREAVRQSRAFVLLASPAAASSPWVGREIEAWLADTTEPSPRWTNRPMLIVLTEGDIVWDEAARDFDWSRTTALPRQLSGYFPAEPLWVDLRWARGSERLSLRNPRFRDNIATLAASIRQVDKEDLLGEEVIHWRRARRLAWSVTAVLAILTMVASALGVVADQRRDEAQALRDAALARALQSEAQQRRTTDPALSLRLSLAALAFGPRRDARHDLVTTLVETHFAGSANLSSGSGDSSDLYAFAVGRDGTLVVSGFMPDTARPDERDLILWDLTDPAHPVRAATLTGHRGRLTAAVVSRDGHRLAAVGGDNVVLWDITDLARPRRLSEVNGGPGVRSAEFSPDGRTLAAVGWQRTDLADDLDTTLADDGWLALWDITDPTLPVELATRAGVHDSRSVGFTPDGHTLITGTRAVTVAAGAGATVWDIADPTRPTPRSRLANASTNLAMSPSQALVALPFERAVHLYDLSDPTHPRHLSKLAGHDFDIQNVVFSSDGRLLATTSPDGTTVVWACDNVNEPTRLATLGAGDTFELAAGFGADGTTLTTVNVRSAVTRWRVGNGLPHALSTMDLKVGVTAVATNPDGDLLATGRLDGTLEVWNIADQSRPVKIASFANPTQSINSVAFNSDGTLLAAGGELRDDPRGEGLLQVWDTHDPASAPAVARLTAPVPIRTVAFHPVLPVLAVTGGTGYKNGWLEILNLSEPGQPEVLAVRPTQGFDTNAFSPGGLLAAFPGGLWAVGDPTSPTPLPTMLPLFSGGPAAFAADGWVTTAIGNGITVWDINDPSLPAPVGLSHDDPSVIHAIKRLRAHPGGLLVAAATASGQLDLWDISERESPVVAVKTPAHANTTTDLAVDPRGAWIATTSLDGTVTLWAVGDLPEVLADPIGMACQLAGSGLTRDEWADFVPAHPYRELCP